MNPKVAHVRNWFNRVYLGGIPLMMGTETAFLSFVCTLTAIEALSGYRYPDSGDTASPGERFRRFVIAYFPPDYGALAGDLWEFRNGMIHGFSHRRFTLVEHQSHAHLRKTDGNSIILNTEDFYVALLQASKKYFGELESVPHLESIVLARLEGGPVHTLSTGPIEVA